MRWLLALALALVPSSALAQTAAPDPGIVVEGQRAANNRPIPMSDWYVAETSHVLVYAKANDERLVRIAHNLEKLHFLLSMLFNRVDEEDPTGKLRVTLIGDSADFTHLGLRNVRWQQGPYPRQFPSMLYYDPREDGPVLASSFTDQKIILQPGRYRASRTNLQPSDDEVMDVTNASFEATGGIDPLSITLGEISVRVTAEGRLYAGFAQHYLLTYFPAAYPRWYLEGFGEIFSTLNADKDGVIEYGAQPISFSKVNREFGFYPPEWLLDGTYLNDRRYRPRWTPYRAWQLAHLLFFSEEWQAPLHNYLAAVARGQSNAEAMAALGDVAALRHQLSNYHGRRAPFERMVYPADRATPPLVRQLSRSEAAYVRGNLELGARLEIPPAPPPGADAATARRMTNARQEAIRWRDRWLAEQRELAARFPSDLEFQLLVAEAECRMGNDTQCLAIADRVLALSPERSGALLWKGVALTHMAIAGPASQRAAKLRAARSYIAQANRADTEAVEPLVAFFQSYTDAGETPPDIAFQGLLKALDTVPTSPAIRLMVGEEYARRGDATNARRTLLPIAAGAYDSPERARAQQVLAGLARR